MSSAFNKATIISSLPSPPSTRQKTPTFTVDRAPSRSSSISDTRSTSAAAELRPFLLNLPTEKYWLPPIQHVIHTPTASPSPPFESYSSVSSVASSPTSLDEEDDDQIERQMIRRKGSIASLLNSDPELRQLDEEESKCNYQSHFVDNQQQQLLNPLKRGRPRQDHVELIYQKKQRTMVVKQLLNEQHESTRATKGLRHFSKQVCDKVAEKGMTSYNEVADELAFDIQSSVGNDKHTYDQKNIRRRVYDALNVLMAMDIISKDKKIIKWLGIPEYYKQEDNEALLKQIEQEQLRQNELMESLHMLRGAVNDKLQKHTQIRNLISRNKSEENTSQRIALPFFMIACSTKQEDIHIDMTSDCRFATLSFQNQSNDQIVYEDTEVLKHLFSNKTQVCSLLQKPYQYTS